MIATVGPSDVECFRSIVERRLGLQFDDSKLGFLGDVLRRRLNADGRLCEIYLGRLEAEAPQDELRALARELTVAETYFFRNIDQFRAFSEVALPDRMRLGRGSLLSLDPSAGCHSGPLVGCVDQLLHTPRKEDIAKECRELPCKRGLASR